MSKPRLYVVDLVGMATAIVGLTGVRVAQLMGLLETTGREPRIAVACVLFSAAGVMLVGLGMWICAVVKGAD